MVALKSFAIFFYILKIIVNEINWPRKSWNVTTPVQN